MDSKSAFVKRFGDLVVLLRVDPGNDAAQDLALSAACAAVEAEPVDVEAGLAWSVIPDDLALKGRLLARQVEAVRVAAGAEPHELLALARALSHDTVVIPSCPNVQVRMVEHLVPPPGVPAAPEVGGDRARGRQTRQCHEVRRSGGRGRSAAGPGAPATSASSAAAGADRRVSGERRLHLIEGQRSEIERLHETLGRSARSMAWDAVLAAALALVRLAPQVPAGSRRMFGIQVRRAIPRRAVESLVDLAEQDAALRARAAEVLRWIGLDAAEIILDRAGPGRGDRRTRVLLRRARRHARRVSAGDAAAREPPPPRDPARRGAARPPGPTRRHRRAGAAA